MKKVLEGAVCVLEERGEELVCFRVCFPYSLSFKSLYLTLTFIFIPFFFFAMLITTVLIDFDNGFLQHPRRLRQ
jgi:hypothetical protein